MSNRDLSMRVHEGMDVLDMDGSKIGKAGEIMPDGHYFNVDTGFLGLGKEYYVPFDAIEDIRENAIYLNASKGNLDAMGWDQPPTETGATGATGRTGGWETGRTSESGTAETGSAEAGRTASTGAGRTVRLHEEELQAHRTPVETGQVNVGKDVVEEKRTIEVPVKREEAFVERRPVERRPADQPIGEGTGENIRVPVREEHVEVEKQPVAYEEVGVGKRRVTDTQQASDTVRREELRTDREGNPSIGDETRDEPRR